MTLFQAIALGIIQGLAEFLPVSSSAHLTLAPWVFGWKDPGLAFDVALHAGTLVALVWYFRADWIELTIAAFSILRSRKIETMMQRRVALLVVATIPGAIAGKLLNDYAEAAFRSPALIASMLIIMGAILWATDKWSRMDRTLTDLTVRDAVLVGLAQMFALIPGVSRSGSTMTAGRFLGLERGAAARFSFLMSMPITAAAVVLKVPQAVRENGFSTPLIAGVLAAAISSWFAITIMLRYISRHSFGIFALYRLVIGLGVFALLFFRG